MILQDWYHGTLFELDPLIIKAVPCFYGFTDACNPFIEVKSCSLPKPPANHLSNLVGDLLNQLIVIDI